MLVGQGESGAYETLVELLLLLETEVEERVKPDGMLTVEEECRIGGRDRVMVDVKVLAASGDMLDTGELVVRDDELTDIIKEIKDPVETPAPTDEELETEGSPLWEVEE